MQPPSKSDDPQSIVIVVPCYNEFERLDVARFQDFAEQVAFPCQFLLVNDGSTDETESLLRKLAEHDPGRFRVLSLSQNVGKAEAVRQGLLMALQADPDLVGFWDADLATPLDAIGLLREVLIERSEIEMVFGARVKLLGRSIQRKPLRHVLGRVFATVTSLVLKLPIYDTQCGAKMFLVTPLLRKILADPFQSRWIFDVELIARAIQQTSGGSKRIAEMIYEYPLTVWHDVQGSKVKPRDFLRAVYELWGIRRKYLRKSSRPAPFAASSATSAKGSG